MNAQRENFAIPMYWHHHQNQQHAANVLQGNSETKLVKGLVLLIPTGGHLASKHYAEEYYQDYVDLAERGGTPSSNWHLN